VYGLRKEYLVGIALGAMLGAAASALSGVFGYAMTLNEGLVWGAAIGGIISAIPQFTRSGAVLTRGSNSGLNLLVGLAGSLVFIAIVIVLTILITRLLL
jgi:hypothetical protein